QAQVQRAVVGETIEQPLYGLAIGQASGERGADWMGAIEPAQADDIEPLAPPAREPALNGLGKDFGEGGRVNQRAVGSQAGGRTVGEIGVMREIDADADDDSVSRALEQDARELGTIDEQ